MPDKPLPLSVVIPVLNEAASLREVLERVAGAPIEKEIIVVDDGSSDASPEIARRFAAVHPNVTVLTHPQRRGKGSALKTAFATCHGECVLVQDADLEYDPADYARLLAALESSGASVVFGTRVQRWHTMRFLQRWGNWLVTWTCNRLYATRLTDVQTCYKLFPRAFLADLQLEATGFEIDPELTAKILRRGWKIVEVPVSYTARTYGQGKKLRGTDGFRALWALLKYRLVSLPSRQPTQQPGA